MYIYDLIWVHALWLKSQSLAPKGVDEAAHSRSLARHRPAPLKASPLEA
jgi:hypothetical protein